MNSTLPEVHGKRLQRYLDDRNQDVNNIKNMIASLRNHGQKHLKTFLSALGIRYIAPIRCYDDAKIFDPAGAIKEIDARYWHDVLKIGGVFDLLPARTREEWQAQIADKNIPPFTSDAVYTTIEQYYAQADTLLSRKADSVFQALSRDHVTNIPQGFGTRFIVQTFWDTGLIMLSESVEERLSDLFDVILIIMKRSEQNKYQAINTIRKMPPNGEWYWIACNTLRARRYKKGTVHFSVHPELAWQLNKLLASLYPQAIPPKFRAKPKKSPKVPPLVMHWLQPGTCDYLRYLLRNGCQTNRREKEECRSVLESIGGVKNDGTWQFNYPAGDILRKISTSGYVPEDKAYQYYPAPDWLAERLVEQVGIKDTDSVLEPSAGTGNIADKIGAQRCSCVELSKLRAEILKKKGYAVTQGNFLKMSPTRKYDKVVMNPPFTGGQAKAHVEHAIDFLKPGGSLAAIVPEGFKTDWITHNWTLSKPIENAFKHASIAVRFLVLEAR